MTSSSEQIAVIRPVSDEVPLVLDSPHSGSTYPADFDFQLDRALLRRSEDAHVDELFEPWTRQGATLLHAHFPRCYIDPNRALEDIDPAMIDGTWPGPVAPSDKVARGAGLIWKQVKKYGEIYSRQLSVTEVQHRIEHCWQPYHQTIESLLDSASQRHGRFIHLNCHSMASMGDHTTEDGAKARPDVVLGDRDGTSCSPALTDAVQLYLSQCGYTVAVNDPYKGVELVRRYSDPAAGRHSLQIELNRALYMNEDTLDKLPGYQQLQTNLSGLCTHLVQLLDQFDNT